MVKDRTVQLTADGKARLEDELEMLRTQRRPDLSARIHEASENGDVGDNSEYENLKEEWVMVDARVHELEQTLERAKVIQRDVPADEVSLGSRVTIRGDDGEEETWIVVSPEEANTMDGTISTESPVGSALMGCRAGDSPTVTTPSGTLVYTIVTVA